MTSTNFNQEHSTSPGHDQSLYYNHLLHFKNNQWDNAFPFLQGLMSNDLFPAWSKYGTTTLSLEHSESIASESPLESAEKNRPIEEETIESIQSREIDSPDTSFTDKEAEEIVSIIEEKETELNLVTDESIPVVEMVDPKHHSDVSIIDRPEIIVGDNVDDIITTDDKAQIDENAIMSQSRTEGTEIFEHEADIPLDSIIEEAQKMQKQPKKAHSIKKSQKKILKKNILFFNELPELNNFNKWLLQQKPMDEGNLVNLLKLQKKAKKSLKKRQLNEVIDASIVKNDKLVTEALAKILASQGHYQDAIEMYKQLILIIPEKSHTFAAQIDELNKKII